MPQGLIKKYISGEMVVRDIDTKNHTAEVIMSDNTLDRYDEVIEAEGYRKWLREFMNHPILISSHKYGGDLRSQLGEWTKTFIDGDALIGYPQYYVNEGNPEADWAWKMVEKRKAAYSVGIIPVKVETLDWEKWHKLKEQGKKVARRVYKEQKLIECSHVLIPANPSALQRSYDEGDENLRGIVSFYFSNLDEIKGLGGDVDITESDIVEKFLIKPFTATEEDTEEKTAIPYTKQPLAAEGTAWNGPAEMSAASVDDLKKMCTVYVGDPKNKTSYKLPHHTAKEYKTVFRGVANAAARMSHTDMPPADMNGVKRHLGEHYKDFGKTPPWEGKKELWDKWEKWCKCSTDDERLALKFEETDFASLFEITLEEATLEEAQAHEFEKILNRGWEETDNEIRHRVKEPSLFVKFRRITLKKDKPRVFAIYGQLKGSSKWSIQALRFPKGDGWALESAKKWVSEHPMKLFEEVENMSVELDDVMDTVMELSGKVEELTQSLKPKEMEMSVGEIKLDDALLDNVRSIVKEEIEQLRTDLNIKAVIPNESYIEHIMTAETKSEEPLVSDEDIQQLMNSLRTRTVGIKSS